MNTRDQHQRSPDVGGTRSCEKLLHSNSSPLMVSYKPQAGQRKIPVVASPMAGGKLHILTMLLEPLLKSRLKSRLICCYGAKPFKFWHPTVRNMRTYGRAPIHRPNK